MPDESPKRVVQKVVCYVMQDEHLLVFTHDAVPIDIAGVQVPAGTIEAGEAPEDAAVREALEETGIQTTVVRYLGEERYDITPSRFEIAERHFYLLVPAEPVDISHRWSAGDPHPSAGGDRAPVWTCWWLPLKHAHVLAAGFGARIGAIYD